MSDYRLETRVTTRAVVVMAPLLVGRVILIVGAVLFAADAGADPNPPQTTPAPSVVPVAKTPAAEELRARLAAKVGRPGGLTADIAARRALLTSPSDRAKRAEVAIADADVAKADVAYYPRLGFTARYARFSPISPPEIPVGPPGAGVPPVTFPILLNQYLLQAGVTVPVSDYLLRIRQSHDAKLSARAAAEMNREVALRATATETKLAYYEWARARLQAVVTKQSVDQAQRHVELAEAGRDAGRKPEVDVMRAESLLASAQLLDERAKNVAILAEQRLKTTLHEPPARDYEIGEDLLSPPEFVNAGDPEALYAEALEQRPELRAFDFRDQSLREDRRAASASGLPRLDAFGNAYVLNPSPRVIPPENVWHATWDVGVQLTWSPNDLGTTNATTRAFDAERQRLAADRAAVTDALRDEIARAVVATEEVRVETETAERGLRAAEENYRVRRELFELGRGTDVDLIDAETDVLSARLEMVRARVDARVARVRLEHAVGRDGLAVR